MEHRCLILVGNFRVYTTSQDTLQVRALRLRFLVPEQQAAIKALTDETLGIPWAEPHRVVVGMCVALEKRVDEQVDAWAMGDGDSLVTVAADRAGEADIGARSVRLALRWEDDQPREDMLRRVRAMDRQRRLQGLPCEVPLLQHR